MTSFDRTSVVLDEQDYINIVSAIEDTLCGEDYEFKSISYDNNGFSLTLYVNATGEAHKEIGTMLSMYEYEELWCFDGYSSFEVVTTECEDEEGECYNASIDEVKLFKLMRQIEKFEKI